MTKKVETPNPHALRKLAQQFKQSRLLIVGDLVADHYVFGQTERISREAPVLIVRHESSEVKLGGGANVAANARDLGGFISTVGVLGDDEMGAALKNEFSKAKIQLKAVVSNQIVTETKTRILAGGLNTTRQQMLRLDKGNQSELPLAIRKRLADKVEKESRQVDAVVVSDYGAGVVGPEVREVVLQLARRGMPVSIDSRHRLAEFAGATVCKPNEPELEELSGRKIRTPKDITEAGFRALEVLQCQALLVTRGRSGMILFQQGQSPEIIPVFGHGDAVDVTGAGDTVLAALSLGLAAKASAALWARVANIAGGLVVQKQGTATVSHQELLEAIGAQR